MKFLIKMRKKLWLPVKWAMGKRKKANSVVLPSKIELVDKLMELDELRAYEERLESWEAVNYIKGQMDILKWIVDGKKS